MDMWGDGVYGSLRIRERRRRRRRRKEAEHGRVVKKKEGQWWWGETKRGVSRERREANKDLPGN
jgi:hypothetical protein